MKRVIVTVIGILLLSVAAAPASARTFASPGTMGADEWKYVKNGDGTYTEYYRGGLDGVPKGEPIRGDTYSASEYAETHELGGEIAVEEGTTGQDASVILGSDIENAYASEKIVGELRTGQLYMDYGEALVGDEAIGEGVAMDTLPDPGILAGALSGAVLDAGVAAATGVAIGTGIDDLMGWPSFFSLETGTNISPGCAYEGESDCKWENGWSSSKVKLGEVSGCEYSEFLYPYSKVALPETGEGELCEYPALLQDWRWEYHSSGGTQAETCRNIWMHPGTYGSDGGIFDDIFAEGCNSTTAAENVPQICPVSPTWLLCFQAFSGPGGDEYSEPQGGYNEVSREIYAPLANLLSYDAYPAEGLKAHEQNVSTPTEHSVEPKEHIEVHTPAPSFVPAPLTHEEIRKGKRKPTKEQEEKSEEGTPLILPLEKGATLPAPINPQVPSIGKDEKWPEYKEELHREGLKEDHEEIVPESEIDTQTGPEGVIQVTPLPGTIVEPDTNIDVRVNPDTAPETKGSGGEGGGGIGPPTEPGIDLPNFGVLCKGFPFGVPCWLAETIEGWSASGSAPTFGSSSFTIKGHTIPSTSFSLSPLESIMVYIRPAMLIFATIGIVLLFYKLAKGGSPDGGGGGHGETFAENDAWHNTPEDEGGPQYR